MKFVAEFGLTPIDKLIWQVSCWKSAKEVL